MLKTSVLQTLRSDCTHPVYKAVACCQNIEKLSNPRPDTFDSNIGKYIPYKNDHLQSKI